MVSCCFFTNKQKNAFIFTSLLKSNFQDDDASTTVPKVNFSDNADISDIEQANVGDVTKALIHFISTRNAQPFWQYVSLFLHFFCQLFVYTLG